jgi:hypothetical protein
MVKLPSPVSPKEEFNAAVRGLKASRSSYFEKNKISATQDQQQPHRTGALMRKIGHKIAKPFCLHFFAQT